MRPDRIMLECAAAMGEALVAVPGAMLDGPDRNEALLDLAAQFVLALNRRGVTMISRENLDALTGRAGWP